MQKSESSSIYFSILIIFRSRRRLDLSICDWIAFLLLWKYAEALISEVNNSKINSRKKTSCFHNKTWFNLFFIIRRRFFIIMTSFLMSMRIFHKSNSTGLSSYLYTIHFHNKIYNKTVKQYQILQKTVQNIPFFVQLAWFIVDVKR